MPQPDNQKEIITKLAALAQAANADPKKLPALREYMAEHDEIFESTNLLLGTARNSLMRKLAGGEGSQALYRREVEALKAKLTEPDDPPLVQLVVERAVMCFLRTLMAEMVMTAGEGRVTYQQSEYLDKELTRAHSRFLKAVEAVERVRLLSQGTRIARAKAEQLEAQTEAERPKKPMLKSA